MWTGRARRPEESLNAGPSPVQSHGWIRDDQRIFWNEVGDVPDASLRVRVLIVEDNRAIRHGIRGVLERDKRFRVVGECESVVALTERAAQLAPDVVLVGLRSWDRAAFEAIQTFQRARPSVRVVVHAASATDRDLPDEPGRARIVLKDLDLGPLLNALAA